MRALAEALDDRLPVRFSSEEHITGLLGAQHQLMSGPPVGANGIEAAHRVTWLLNGREGKDGARFSRRLISRLSHSAWFS